jgi:uncharacterized membrane protein YbhN (UPF0104 family)
MSTETRPQIGRPDPLQETGLGLKVTPRKLALFALFVVLSVVALYLLLPQLAGLDQTWNRIQSGRPGWLVLAGILTFGMFGGYVLEFHAVYETRLRWQESLQITLAALAATRLFSAGGAGGLVLQAWALRRAGLDAREVGDRTVTFIVIQYIVYTATVAIVGYALYFGLLSGPAPFAMTFLPATLAVVVTVLGLSLGFVPPDLQKRLDKGPMRRLAHLPASASAGIREALRRLRTPDACLAGALCFWGFQIAVLWACFHAFGDTPPLGVLIVGFFVGMLGNLLPLPGGIGGVDGGMIGAFAALGVPFGLATVAVLAYRGFTFWLPTIPGIVAFITLRRTVERWGRNDRAASYT